MCASISEHAELPCPECGYDLRGTDSGRCPECGSTFDRAQLSRSQIAWEHRHEIGRLKAWWRTVWQATFRVKALSDSITAPIDWYAARRFWLINVLLLYLPIGILLAVFDRQLREGANEVVARSGSMASMEPVLVRELTIPIAAGYAVPGVSFAVALGLLMTWSGVHTYLFQAAPLPRESQDRAAAVGLYASGSMVGGALMMLAGALVLLAVLFQFTVGEIAFSVSATMAQLLMFAVTWSSIWRIYRRITHAGTLRSLCVALAIPGWWLLAAVLWVYVLPWCVGLIAVIVRSILQ